MHGEKLICQHHSTRIAGKRRGVRGAGNITANRSVLCLRIGDIYRGSYTNKFEEFGLYIFVHAQATVRCGEGLHPSSVESICTLELTPVWHGSSFEFPTGRFIAQVTRDNTSTR